MGEVLRRDGVARLVGVDIVPEARDAAYRDRPTVYDARRSRPPCSVAG
jgi:hypothetical protein